MKRLLILFFIVSGQISLAQVDPSVLDKPETQSSYFFSNKTKGSTSKQGSLVFFPFASYLLPGLGQYINGQTGAGLVYSSTAVIGLGVASSAANRLKEEPLRNEQRDDLDSRDPLVRQYLWGLKTYDLAGSLSLYHSFHSMLVERRLQGEFKFLPQESERVDELLLAPFDFSYLKRASTWLPLGLGLGLVVLAGKTDNYKTRSLNSEDVLFSSAISYNAGVGEEALFRGWMFPLFTETYGVENGFWANLTQATIFAALHYSEDNRLPLAQLLGGYYFGFLTKRNAWSLKESIFVHTWWDIIIFAAMASQGDRKASLYVPIYQSQF